MKGHLIKIKFIAKMEKGAVPVLFFPEHGANHGRIECYAHEGQHCEADTRYMAALRNPTDADSVKVAALVREYEGIGPTRATMVRVRRDSQKMRAARWA